jgi:hypothetical protein
MVCNYTVRKEGCYLGNELGNEAECRVGTDGSLWLREYRIKLRTTTRPMPKLRKFRSLDQVHVVVCCQERPIPPLWMETKCVCCELTGFKQ